MARRWRSNVSQCSGPGWGTIHCPQAIGHRETRVCVGCPLVVDQLRVELIDTPQGLIWRVCGMGYCTYHRQRWQAEVMYECLRVAKGLPQADDD